MIDTLAELHYKGYVHGNLSPKCFRIKAGRVYLMEFDKVTQYRVG